MPETQELNKRPRRQPRKPKNDDDKKEDAPEKSQQDRPARRTRAKSAMREGKKDLDDLAVDSAGANNNQNQRRR